MRAEPNRPPLTLAPEASPDEATIRAFSSGLDAYNAGFGPRVDWSPHWIIGRDAAHAVQAGIRYVIAYEWLFIQWLWVAEPYRKQGVGSRLLSQAESAARENGCRGAYVDTFAFQAPLFYPRHGYREFGRLNDFPPGHARIWLSKAL
jgi:GNAT superfamily N-acetyltransferase